MDCYPPHQDAFVIPHSWYLNSYACSLATETVFEQSTDLDTSLIKKYFDAVDPVYPMIHRESFLRDYEFFWSLPTMERPSTEGDLIALIFVMLAMGTQFVALPSPEEKEQTAEFYGEATCPSC